MDGELEGITIRAATPDDAELITRMRWQMYLATGRDEETANRSIYGVHYADWLRGKLAAGEYIGWLAEAGAGQAVATVGLWVIEGQPSLAAPEGLQGYILNVFTDDRYRGRGIARRMMELAIEECRRRKVKKVSLHASVHGRRLYAKMGFKKTKEMRLEL